MDKTKIWFLLLGILKSKINSKAHNGNNWFKFKAIPLYGYFVAMYGKYDPIEGK
jgi:hypothetical protein